MKILAVRSVPLSKETRDAWNRVGVRFARRNHDSEQDIERIVETYAYDAVLNLGGFVNDCSVPVWNAVSTVSKLNHRDLRSTISGFGMPPQHTKDTPHWHKTNAWGWGGEGVRYCEELCPVNVDHEIQAHINGTEYRVITVGNLIVQAFRKDDLEWDSEGRHHFNWKWVGVNGISNSGIIPLLKEAVGLVPNGARTVLGWDIILADRPWIIECNTSMGVNQATAQRIVKAMEVSNG